MLPQYNPDNPSLLDSIVCFTDILGFSNLILQSPNRLHGNQLLKNLHTILKNQYAELKIMNPQGQLKTFTDNVILAYPIFEDGEGQSGNLFMSFINYQLEMTMNGYFLRGGVAVGDYYGDDDFAYGSALIEAHNLECSSANYPRIILSKKMVRMVAKHLGYYGKSGEAPQSLHLLKDIDDIVFVNYLYGLKEEYEYMTGDKSEYIQKIQQHKDIVFSNLSVYKKNNNDKLYSKYEWVAQYHNYYCDQYFEPSEIQQFNLKILPIAPRKFSRIAMDKLILI
ncbi:hypothetical protein ABH957_003106 [Bacillus sp. RC242]|uniref:hypothetical protein n=1 Tax=Bacillus sp. RC242 TaxID=3156286 RepID=UPI0038399877